MNSTRQFYQFKNNKSIYSLILFIVVLFAWMPINAMARVIRTPGLYSLGRDVFVAPTSPIEIIRIEADNVVLDLCNHLVVQSNAFPDVCGIMIAPNVRNVTVKNGTIRNVSDTGIVVNEGCSEITIKNITFESCGKRAASFLGAVMNPIKTVMFEKFTALNSSKNALADSVIFMQNSQETTISKGRIERNGDASHDLMVVRMDNVDNANVKNIHVTANVAGSNMMAYCLSAVNRTTFSKCTARQNSAVSAAGDCVGFELQANTSCLNNMFDSCETIENTAMMAGGTCTGFRVGMNNDDNTFQSCTASRNNSDGTCEGFNLTNCSNNVVTKSTAQEQRSATANAVGICLDACTGCEVTDSTGSDQSSTAAISMGIELTNNCAECVLQNNSISRNNGSTAANSFGMRVTPAAPNMNKNTFKQNTASRNGGAGSMPVMSNQFSGLAVTQQVVVQAENVNSITEVFTNVALV